MQLPSWSVGFLVDELSAQLSGGFVKKIQSVDVGIRFRIYANGETHDLILAPNAFFISHFRIPSTQNAKGLVQTLRARLEGKRLLSMVQHEHDRLVILQFAQDTLVCELFAKGNIILIDSTKTTLACLRREEWKDREIKPKKPYAFPASRPRPHELDAHSFFKRLVSSDKKLVGELVGQFDVFPLLAQEALLQSDVENTPAKQLTRENATRLYDVFVRFSQTPAAPHVVRLESDEFLLPFALEKTAASRTLSMQPAASFNDPLDSFFASQTRQLQTGTSAAVPNSKIAALEKTLSDLREQQQLFDAKTIELERVPEWLYLHYVEVQALFFALQKAVVQKRDDAQVLSAIKAVATPKSIASCVSEVRLKNKTVVLEP